MFRNDQQLLRVTVKFYPEHSLPDVSWDLWRGFSDHGSHPAAAPWTGYSFFVLYAHSIDAAQGIAEKKWWLEHFAGSVWDEHVTTPAADAVCCDDSDKEVEIGQRSLQGKSKYPTSLRPRDAAKEVGQWYSLA